MARRSRPARSRNLARGLGHGIPRADDLSAGLAALQRAAARGRAAGNGSRCADQGGIDGRASRDTGAARAGHRSASDAQDRFPPGIDERHPRAHLHHEGAGRPRGRDPRSAAHDLPSSGSDHAAPHSRGTGGGGSGRHARCAGRSGASSRGADRGIRSRSSRQSGSGLERCGIDADPRADQRPHDGARRLLLRHGGSDIDRGVHLLGFADEGAARPADHPESCAGWGRRGACRRGAAIRVEASSPRPAPGRRGDVLDPHPRPRDGREALARPRREDQGEAQGGRSGRVRPRRPRASVLQVPDRTSPAGARAVRDAAADPGRRCGGRELQSGGRARRIRGRPAADPPLPGPLADHRPLRGDADHLRRGDSEEGRGAGGRAVGVPGLVHRGWCPDLRRRSAGQVHGRGRSRCSARRSTSRGRSSACR